MQIDDMACASILIVVFDPVNKMLLSLLHLITSPTKINLDRASDISEGKISAESRNSKLHAKWFTLLKHNPSRDPNDMIFQHDCEKRKLACIERIEERNNY